MLMSFRAPIMQFKLLINSDPIQTKIYKNFRLNSDHSWGKIRLQCSNQCKTKYMKKSTIIDRQKKLFNCQSKVFKGILPGNRK